MGSLGELSKGQSVQLQLSGGLGGVRGSGGGPKSQAQYNLS